MKGHSVGEGFLAITANIADAGGSVAVEETGKQLTDKAVVNLALAYVDGALGTGSETL